MNHIWSQHAYLYEKVAAEMTSLFCWSLEPHIEALIEYAVWNCMREMKSITYGGAHIVPMLCEFPQYIGWGLTGQTTCWLEVWLCMADLHIWQVFPVSVEQYVSYIVIIICYCFVYCFLLCFIFAMLHLFNLSFHKYSERCSVLNNNVFSPTLQKVKYNYHKAKCVGVVGVTGLEEPLCAKTGNYLSLWILRQVNR